MAWGTEEVLSTLAVVACCDGMRHTSLRSPPDPVKPKIMALYATVITFDHWVGNKEKEIYSFEIPVG